MTKQELCQTALDMLSRSYSPYSRFPVGAALACADGSVYTGCNIENAAYGPSVSEGKREFVRIAVAASTKKFCAPCGVCRQVLQEFAPDLEVILVNCDGETKELTQRDLLPYSFDGDSLTDCSGDPAGLS